MAIPKIKNITPLNTSNKIGERKTTKIVKKKFHAIANENPFAGIISDV